MGKLPTQLKWARFTCVLRRLGYDSFGSNGGSARSFLKPGGNPDLVTFHEPHGNDTIRQGTFTEYLRKLRVDRATFLSHLEHC